MNTSSFRFGQWEIIPDSNTVRDGELRRQLEPRAMQVLAAICERRGAVVSADQLLEQCWGSTDFGDNPIHKTITQLRRVLGDSAAAPIYIETIRKRGYRSVAEVSPLPAADAPAPGSWSDGSPFRGLEAFDAAHAAVFFGREELTARLVADLARLTVCGRALLLLGPSGSGKTSVIRAGLLPALERGGGQLAVRSCAFLDLGELADGDLLAGVGGAMLDWEIGGAPLLAGCSAHSLGAQLAQDPAAIALRLGQVLGEARAVLAIDRFEAVFARPHGLEHQCAALVGALDILARSGRVLVVIACRNDFYPRIAEIEQLMAGKADGAHVDITPPGRGEMARMIRLPALAAQLRFGVDPASGEHLDDLLCHAAAASPDALPLLQYTLHELFRLRSADGELQVEAYRAMGGLDGVLGARAEALVAAMDGAAHLALGRVLSLLLSVTAEDDRVTSRRAPWSALLTAHERNLVGALVQARLFVSELAGQEAVFGIAHEALLRRWPRIADWLTAHRDSLRARARVAQASTRWAEHGRRADLLLPAGKQLDEGRALLAAPAIVLTAQERELIGASVRRARARERLRFGVLVLVLTLALLAAIAAVTAGAARTAAQQRRAQAEALMGYMVGDFADKLRPLGRLDLLDDVSAKAMGYLSADDSDSLDGASLAHRAKALEVIGELRIARADPAGAAAALQAARVVLERQAASAPQDVQQQLQLLTQLGANAFWLGKLRLDAGDWAAAQLHLERYRDYAQRTIGLDPQDVDAWIELSYAHNSLGSLALKRGDARAAVAAFARSIELKERAARARPADRMLAKDLADSLSWAGSANEVLGRLADARQLYLRQRDLAETLHRASVGDALWSNKLAESFQHLARLSLVEGDDTGAQAGYRRAETLLRANVATAPDNRVWQENLAFVQLALLRAGDAPPAAQLPALSALRRQFAGLTARDPRNAVWAKHEALLLHQLATVLLAGQRAKEAAPVLEAARVQLEQVHGRTPSDILARTMLAGVWITHAELERQLGGQLNSQSDTEAGCRRAAALLLGHVPVQDDFRVLDPWVRSQLCLQRKDAASSARASLTRMGYRERTYLKYLSSYN